MFGLVQKTIFRLNSVDFRDPEISLYQPYLYSNRSISTKNDFFIMDLLSKSTNFSRNGNFSIIVNKNLSIVELFKKLNKRFSSELLYWLYLHSRINIWEYLWIIKRPDKSTSPPTQSFSILSDEIQFGFNKTHKNPFNLWNAMARHCIQIFMVLNRF